MKVAFRSRNPMAVPSSDLRRAFVRFRPALHGQSRLILGAVMTTTVITGLTLLRPWPMTWIIDYLVVTTDLESISMIRVGVYALVAFAVPTLIGLANERLQITVAKVSRKATVRIRSQVFEHLQRVELAEHHTLFSGDLLVRMMGDVNMVRDLLFPSWLNLMARASVIVGGSVVFVLVDWRLFMMALVPIPLLWISVERSSSAIKTAVGKQRRKEGAIAADATEALGRIGLIKAYAAEGQTAAEFRNLARSAERATMAAAKQSARMSRMTEVLTGAGIAVVLIAGVTQVRAGVITVGELVLVISYTRMLYKPIRKLTTEGARLAKATASALRVMDVLDLPVEDGLSGVPIGSLMAGITFDQVSHTYPDGRTSIVDLSFHIPARSIVAIVGENGSGKSTVLSLLLRLYQPDSGEIRIGDVPIGDLRLHSYRNQIAFVPQELTLFSGTIRENIAFGKPDATDEEIETAATLALLDPVLERLPDGLDTELDEGGSSLSGGQARRVMLARAAVRDTSILLLDEPLSSLDYEAQQTVAAAIRSIAAGRTTIVVHHGDLDTIAPDYRLELAAPTTTPRLRVVGE